MSRKYTTARENELLADLSVANNGFHHIQGRSSDVAKYDARLNVTSSEAKVTWQVFCPANVPYNKDILALTARRNEHLALGTSNDNFF